MELHNIHDSLDNIPSKHKTIYEWNGRYFTHFKSAQDAYSSDRVQGGCNVVVEYKRNKKRAKKLNMCGEWYESDSFRAM